MLSRSLLNLVLCAVAVTAQDFDYLIVGGGAAGALFAGKLASNPKLRVGIIEAGFHAEQNFTLVPELFYGFIGTDLDWQFKTVPQKHLNGKVLSLPRGKALGGTAAVNGMFFVRGAKPEYDSWEQLGNPGWNWNTVSSYIKSIENFTPAPQFASLGSQDANHGSSGPINVSFSNYYSNPGIINPFYDTMATFGVPRNTQQSAGNTVGVYQVPSAIEPKNRTRSYSVNGFLTPLKGNPNLVINTGALATKIIFASGTPLRATGVQYVQDGITKTLNVKSTGKVVIAAGTYHTPKLLELSGIGNAAVLKNLSIPVLQNLAGVGENLQDHIGVLGSWELQPGYGPSLDSLSTNSSFAAEQWDSYFTNRSGIYASIPSSTVAFFRYENIIPAPRLVQLKKGLDAEIAKYKGKPVYAQLLAQRALLESKTVPQVELVITSQVQAAGVTPEPGKSYISVAVNIVKPFSRGKVHAVSTDPSISPAIDVNFLDFNFDYETLTEAFSWALNKLTKTAPFSDALKAQLGPPANITSDQIGDYVKANIYSVWHPVGSASMLPLAQNGVVDSKLKVYGTQNLHVIDACLIPMELSTHSMSSVYGNAAYAADLLS